MPYAQVGLHEFTICDDNDYIFENPQVRQGLTYKGSWAMQPHAGNWHPLTWLSHMLDWQLFGDTCRAAHHVENVFYHMAAAIVLFLALRMMTGSLWPSAVVAAFFAIHPLRVESVAWAAERKDVLGASSGCLPCGPMPGTPSAAARCDPCAALVRVLEIRSGVRAFGLGLASKSMLVTLPCALVLLDIWPLRRWALLNRADAARVPLSAAAVLVAVPGKTPPVLMSYWASSEAVVSQDLAVALNTAEGLPLNYRIDNALVVLRELPVEDDLSGSNLAVFYPHDAMLPGHTVAPHGAEFLGDLSATVCWPANWSCRSLRAASCWPLPRRSGRLSAAGRTWPSAGSGILGTLVPVIGLVQVGTQSMADRYSYTPSIGLYIAVAWGLAKWPHVGRRRSGFSRSACPCCWRCASCSRGFRWDVEDQLYAVYARGQGLRATISPSTIGKGLRHRRADRA